jgi:hypothetical protein
MVTIPNRLTFEKSNQATMEAEMTTDNEYPKACSMQEAIECVKAGGEAQARGTSEEFNGRLFIDTYRSVMNQASTGYVSRPWGGWQYQITKPAPSATPEPRTYSTAEAITELYAGRVKKFTGKDSYGDRVSCSLTSSGNVYAINSAGYALNHIPNIRWSPVAEKPAAITRDYLIGPGDDHRDRAANVLRDTIRDARAQYNGDVRVTWKVEAV